MMAHLQEAYPYEACGLLAGEAGQVQHLYRVTNRLASRTAYEMEPKEQLMAMLDLEERGWELLAVYHSHPDGPDRPSSTDIAQAYYPEAYHIIVSLRDRDEAVARGFSIVDGHVSEIPFQIV